MNKEKIRRILVITLSNIGDAVLTTAVIQALRDYFPGQHLAVLVGPRAFAVFKNDTRIDKKIVYEKSISLRNKIGLITRLRHEHYDLVVDLRNTAFSIFLGARYRSSIFGKAPKSLVHMKDRHLWKLQALGLDTSYIKGPSLKFSEDEQGNIEKMWRKWQIQKGQCVVALAPGARNMTKLWEKQGYRELVKLFYKELDVKILLVGDKQDAPIAEEIGRDINPALINLCGKTSIGELACLLSKCALVVSNDSAPTHIAWAVNTPVVSIFGPTDYRKYAPGGKYDRVIRKDLKCSPCEQSLCPKGTRDCMKLVSADDVFAACKEVLDART
ncbi:MAG: glycosyltransferase family 9 protein [Candidatus Omnitrophica bacterium]|nr:glycosyltransferase family 9 protein [Candidatus Omnitrophota bacterium]